MPEITARIIWNRTHHAAWDSNPERYLEAGTIRKGRATKLGTVEDGEFRAHVGVQHQDPSLGYHTERICFFVSYFSGSTCIGTRSYATMAEALQDVAAVHQRVKESAPRA